jgi:hypothetical protein
LQAEALAAQATQEQKALTDAEFRKKYSSYVCVLLLIACL